MITSNDVRQKYLDFFKKSGHKKIDPAPLVLENDTTTLFTSSGMQPLVPYLMGEKHKDGKRLVDSQPSIRLQDIEEVGDNRHTTYFEMLGNWSLGDYFKKEQLPWIWEFLTQEIGLPKEKLYVSIFEGNDLVPKDLESKEIWLSLGVSESHIFEYGVKKNWWSRSGTPDQMPVGEIGGPDSEIFFDFGESLGLHEKSEWKDEKCHPNCDCGRFLEIGNSVFIQYKKTDKGLEELPQKNVDFGGGLERITAAINNDPDIFKIDSFSEIIEEIEKWTNKKYSEDTNKPLMRIIADHLRAAVFLINEGVEPSNTGQGYILRRLIRRATVKMHQLGGGLNANNLDIILDRGVLYVYDGIYFNRHSLRDRVFQITNNETEKFNKTLDKGLKKVNLLSPFDLHQTYGFPPEITEELLKQQGKQMDWNKYKVDFEAHKNMSRTAGKGMFKGGLIDHSVNVVRLHTATHILLATLRKVVGEHVVQKGQNITPERSRFDFPNPEKLTSDQIKEVEDMINDVISKELPVNFVVLPKDEAIKTGAIHAFNEKYADTVKVYYVGSSLEEAVSREFCGGPHVTNTKEIGHVTINKQEKIGSGVIRLYIVLDNKNVGIFDENKRE